MSLKQRIDSDIKQAMLSKNKAELDALRSIKSMILLAETEKGRTGELTGEAEGKLLMKAAKQRKESADIFQEQSRQDLADKELFQLEVINRYLPKPLSEDELRRELKTIIEESGASGPQEMGKVMGIATKKLAGKADGKAISALVKELLAP
ncbi:MAG TPA: GatB/YqeY domain-containing protein [Cyclobacteriaceae bacterium]|nr:GatB/YqeY domain-containing protein [Cyclobacteriaceae bacterium]